MARNSTPSRRLVTGTSLMYGIKLILDYIRELTCSTPLLVLPFLTWPCLYCVMSAKLDSNTFRSQRDYEPRRCFALKRKRIIGLFSQNKPITRSKIFAEWFSGSVDLDSNPVDDLLAKDIAHSLISIVMKI
jgi:hypothetical protein